MLSGDARVVLSTVRDALVAHQVDHGWCCCPLARAGRAPWRVNQ